jgi:hypothetical protein
LAINPDQDSVDPGHLSNVNAPSKESCTVGIGRGNLKRAIFSYLQRIDFKGLISEEAKRVLYLSTRQHAIRRRRSAKTRELETRNRRRLIASWYQSKPNPPP